MISPIQHGCETVQAANRQLRQLIARHSAPGAPDNISPLSMRLQVPTDGRRRTRAAASHLVCMGRKSPCRSAAAHFKLVTLMGMST